MTPIAHYLLPIGEQWFSKALTLFITKLCFYNSISIMPTRVPGALNMSSLPTSPILISIQINGLSLITNRDAANSLIELVRCDFG
jgi:hypothetical protein